jgi:heme exporter protein D
MAACDRSHSSLLQPLASREEQTLVHSLSLETVAHVIALATGPAFLIAAVLSFLYLLATRMAQVVDRARALDDIDDKDERRARLKADMPLLRRRARLLNLATALSVVSGVITAVLIVVAFLGALLDFETETVIVAFFILALVSFMVSLFFFGREVVMSVSEFKHYL